MLTCKDMSFVIEVCLQMLTCKDMLFVIEVCWQMLTCRDDILSCWWIFADTWGDSVQLCWQILTIGRCYSLMLADREMTFSCLSPREIPMYILMPVANILPCILVFW